jgi:hypothetical protein
LELRHLRAVERLNLGLAVLLCLASFFFGRGDVRLGVFLGAALSVLNFHAIRRLVSFGLGSQVRRKQLLVMSLILGKMALLVGLVYVIVRYAPVSVLAFIVGLSVFLLSILIASLLHGAGDDASPSRGRRRGRKGRRATSERAALPISPPLER